MMKHYKQILCSSLLALGLTACGGGGGGDSASSGSSPADSGVGSDEPVTMASIKVAPGYDFTTSQQLEVNVDVSSVTDQRAYIAFYQDWSGSDNAPIPNPDSQLLMKVTDNGTLSQTLTIGKQQQSLLMVVMFADTSISPVTDVFAVDGEGYAYP